MLPDIVILPPEGTTQCQERNRGQGQRAGEVHALPLLCSLEAGAEGIDRLLQHGLLGAPALRHCGDVALYLGPATPPLPDNPTSEMSRSVRGYC